MQRMLMNITWARFRRGATIFVYNYKPGTISVDDRIYHL